MIELIIEYLNACNLKNTCDTEQDTGLSAEKFLFVVPSPPTPPHHLAPPSDAALNEVCIYSMEEI